MFSKIKKKIKSLYRNDLARPFMYAITVVGFGATVGGAFWLFGWAVGEISGLVAGLRTLHVPASFSMLITTPVFWQAVAMFAIAAFAVGAVLSIVSVVMSKVNGVKAKSLEVQKNKTKSKDISKGIYQKSKEHSKWKGYNKKNEYYKQNLHHISHLKPNISKKNYNIKCERESPTTTKYFDNKYRKLKQQKYIFDKKIRNFKKQQQHLNKYKQNNNNYSKQINQQKQINM